MADRGRPILHKRSDIRLTLQKQFSRPMTGHTPRKLPSFDAISRIIAMRAVIPYTRLNNITWGFQKVKHNFRKNHKILYCFSFKTANPVSTFNCRLFFFCLIFYFVNIYRYITITHLHRCFSLQFTLYKKEIRFPNTAI